MRIPLTLLRRRPAPAASPDGPGAPRAASPRAASPRARARGVRVRAQTRTTYQLASLLLEYPNADLVARLPVLRSAALQAHREGGASAARLLPLIDHLAATPLASAQADYVETFDLRRRCCLHLTYYAHGDTRRRGMALLDLKSTYRDSGADPRADELPDHLGVLLEFAATIDPPVGRVLLLDHRPGIELLRIALAEAGSPYACAIEAVTQTLPALVGSERDAIAALIAQGPPDEEVGMEAYRSGATPLPHIDPVEARP